MFFQHFPKKHRQTAGKQGITWNYNATFFCGQELEMMVQQRGMPLSSDQTDKENMVQALLTDSTSPTRDRNFTKGKFFGLCSNSVIVFDGKGSRNITCHMA